MNDYRTFVRTTFNRLKRKDPGDPLVCLPVYDASRVLVGYLKPIIAEYKVTAPHYVSLLGRWRQENPSVSRGTFTITDARTERWLDELVIARDDRILFMVEDLQGREVGHLGFSSFIYETKECEVDYVLRGVKGATPGMMQYAMHALMRWGLRDVRLAKITLRVFADNAHAIRFYQRCGFSRVRTIPLYKHELPDEVRWEEDPEALGQLPGRYYLEMLLDNARVPALRE